MHFWKRNLECCFCLDVVVAILVLVEVIRFFGDKTLSNDGVPRPFVGFTERAVLNVLSCDGDMVWCIVRIEDVFRLCCLLEARVCHLVAKNSLAR